MTPQETDLITTLLSRLKNVAGQSKDPDADALIRRAMAEQPDAPYYLTQTVLIQDLSLHNAQNRIAELEQQLSDAQAQAARPAPTSFLGGLFGSRQPAAAPPQTISAGSVPTAGPWTRAPQVAAAPMAQPYSRPYQQQPYQPQSGYGQTQPGYGQTQPGYGPQASGGGFMGGGSAAGGFLRSAATTAAGVAGGALLFQGIESLFGHSAGGGLFGGGQGATPGLGETVINNYYGSDGAGAGNQDTDSWGGADAGGQGSGGDQDFSSAGLGGDQDYGSGQDYGADQDFSSSDFGGGDSNPC